MSTTSTVPAAARTQLPTGAWKVDPVHSSVEFQVKHLGIATVKGRFNEFEGTLEIGAGGARASGSVEVASIDTREPQRDAHLRSADFFEVESFPRIEFASTAIRPLDEDEFEIDADLTIHGVTRPVTLRAVFEGAETDPQGNERVCERSDQPQPVRDEVQRGARLRQRRRQRPGEDPGRRLCRQAVKPLTTRQPARR
jgi:polyisoprenoid-binding protein YceI